jgi:ABC-type proline/glycine betaine transport system permease subunit
MMIPFGCEALLKLDLSVADLLTTCVLGAAFLLTGIPGSFMFEFGCPVVGIGSNPKSIQIFFCSLKNLSTPVPSASYEVTYFLNQWP